MWTYNNTDELYHYGILGMKWGIRRYQNKDGTLTPEGKRQYKLAKTDMKKFENKYDKRLQKLDSKYQNRKYKNNIITDFGKYEDEHSKIVDEYLKNRKRIEKAKKIVDKINKNNLKDSNKIKKQYQKIIKKLAASNFSKRSLLNNNKLNTQQKIQGLREINTLSNNKNINKKTINNVKPLSSDEKNRLETLQKKVNKIKTEEEYMKFDNSKSGQEYRSLVIREIQSTDKKKK